MRKDPITGPVIIMDRSINKLVRAFLFIIPAILVCCAKPDPINIIFNKDSEVISYGAERLMDHLRSGDSRVGEGPAGKSGQQQIIADCDEDRPDSDLAPEGFRISQRQNTVTITGDTARGCLHGIMDLLEKIGPANDQGTIMREFWDPGFIREHIRTNRHDHVDGYFVGSERYISAADYSYYYLWGKLTKDPEESDVTPGRAFENRYENIDSLKMLQAYSQASKVPEYLASFHKGTWDFILQISCGPVYPLKHTIALCEHGTP
jgi:hypothetical protein